MRRFEGEFNRHWKDIAAEVREENPKLGEPQIERTAKDRRNFNDAHLKAYLKGKQIFHFGRDEFNRPVPFVVKAHNNG